MFTGFVARLVISAAVVALAAFAVGCGGASVVTKPEGSPAPEPIRVRPEIVDVDTQDGSHRPSCPAGSISQSSS